MDADSSITIVGTASVVSTKALRDVAPINVAEGVIVEGVVAGIFNG